MRISDWSSDVCSSDLEGLDSKRTKDLDAKIKEYRKLVNDLKVSHRNRYIAHVNTDVAVVPRVLDDPVPFEETASLAVNLLDAIIGRRIGYTFKMASDLKFDLRKAISCSDERRVGKKGVSTWR